VNYIPEPDIASGASQDWDLSTPDETGFSGTRLDRIGIALNREVTSGRMPGAVVGILRYGKLAYLRAVGWRDPAARIPMTPDSLFWIASMTKPIVAVAALTLVEQGQLLLGDSISAHLPEFTGMRVAGPDEQGRPGLVPARRQPVVHDLMTHTAGIIEGLLGNSPVHARYAAAVGDGMTGYTAAEFRARLAGLPLFNQPGEIWHYGWGFDLLGQIIERITQSSLGEYLARTVTGPLGMTGTRFAWHGMDTTRWAQPFPPGDERFALPDLSMARFDSGGAGLIGTAEDYLRFVSFLLERLRGRGTAILAPATVTAMTTDQLDPHTDVSRLTALHARGHGFGLGVAVRRSAGALSPGSPGEFSWPGAAGTYWWADPRYQLGVVLMTHTPGRQAHGRLHELTRTLVYQALIPDQRENAQQAWQR
jgi:CubicO group peptidase (beta-lactamase class C family)